MKRLTRVAALLVPLVLVAAACGSDDNSSDGDSSDAVTESTDAMTESTDAMTESTEAMADGGDGVAAAQAIVDAASEPATEIGPTIPLDGVPEPKTVAWLECEQPACAA